MPAIVCVDRPPPALALRCIQLHLSLPTSLLVLAPESPTVGGASAKAVCCRVERAGHRLRPTRPPARPASARSSCSRARLPFEPRACSADRVAALCSARRCCVGRTGSGVLDPPYISPISPLVSPLPLQVCCVGGARASFAQLPKKEPERRDAWRAFCRRGAGCGDEEGPRDGPGDGLGDGPGDGLVVAWRPAAVMGSEEGEVPREVRGDGGEVRRDGGEVRRDGSSGPEADAELFPPPVLSPIEQLLGDPSPNPSPNPDPDPNPNLGARSRAAVKVTRALDLALILPLS